MATIITPIPTTTTTTPITTPEETTTTTPTTTPTSTPTSTPTTTPTTLTTPTTTSTTSTSTTPTDTSTSTSSSSSTTSSSSSTTTSSSSSIVTSLSTSIATADDGQTSTVIVTASGTEPSASRSAISDSSSGGKGFFDNKGAVAGVFTVVGLVGLVLFVVLATNAIRRRRARKFDDEVAAAAAEANASPRYPFDDYDDPAPGGGYSSYSDPDSHGTLSQVPLTHTGESYNMSEFNGGYPSYGGAAAVGTGVSAGAAGIGASRSLARRNTQPNNGTYADVGGSGMAGFGATQGGMHGQTAPYNAFAGPLGGIPSDPYDPYTAGSLGIKRQGSRNGNDLLEAAGMGAAGVGAAAAMNHGTTQNGTQTLDRKHSQGTQRTLSPDNSKSIGTSAGTTQESYAAHYQPDFRPDEHQYQPPPAAAPAPPPASAGEPLPNPFARDGASDEEAYGAESYYPAGRVSHDESRMSIRDEEDYGRAGRTLKVANE